MKLIKLSSKLLVAAVFTSIFTFSLIKFTFSFEDVNFVQELNSGYQEPIDVVVSNDGEIFVLDSRLSQVFVYDETGYFLRSFGTRGSGPGAFSRPQSITISPNNEILVADTGNNRVQAFDQEGKFLFEFGSSGNLRGQFQSPTGLATDPNGFILVADSRNQRIQIFSPKGIYRYYIPFPDEPVDVAIDRNNNYYILRPEAGVVSVITTEKITDVRCMIGKKNYIESAAALTVDTKGSIYFTETFEHSIKKFDAADGLLLSFGSEGRSRGQFKYPAGIFVDQNDKIYAVDTKNNRVQILQNTGNTKAALIVESKAVPMIDYVETIPADLSVSDIQISPQGEVISLSERNDYLMIHGGVNKVVGTSGRSEGQFSSPAALDYGPDGKIYVADTGNNRIQIFDSEGRFEYAFGERGSKTGQFSSPQGIVVDSNGIIFVSDTQNNRIQMFNKDGIFLMAFGTRSIAKKDQKPADGTFMLPTALALDTQEDLYVLDSGNNRVQVFDSKGKHLATFGSFGEKYKQLSNPVDIAIDQENYIYIAEQDNNRVQIFPPGNLQSLVFGSSGLGYAQFQELSGVDVYQDKIYVSDQRNAGIRVFRFEKNFKQAQPKKSKVKPQKPKEVTKDDEDEFELR